MSRGGRVAAGSALRRLGTTQARDHAGSALKVVARALERSLHEGGDVSFQPGAHLIDGVVQGPRHGTLYFRFEDSLQGAFGGGAPARERRGGRQARGRGGGCSIRCGGRDGCGHGRRGGKGRGRGRGRGRNGRRIRRPARRRGGRRGSSYGGRRSCMHARRHGPRAVAGGRRCGPRTCRGRRFLPGRAGSGRVVSFRGRACRRGSRRQCGNAGIVWVVGHGGLALACASPDG